jgi:orotate phosphoribosyltransferase
MSQITVAAFLELAAARRGHFRLESGHHSQLWLDLDPLFADPRRVDPFVAGLSSLLRLYNLDGVCGPLLGGAFLAQLVAHALEVEFYFTERVIAQPSSGMYRAGYRLAPGLGSRIQGKRIGLVDDVMSAGSALRGTYGEIQTHGAVPVVAGALLVYGSTGADFFSRHSVPVEAVARDEYEMWLPAECPLCAGGRPRADVAAPLTNNEP